jgi:anti-anti-sigma regulatory factor
LSAPALVLHVRGRIEPDDVGTLLARVEHVLDAGGSDALTCDVGDLVDPDVLAMDTLARMVLAARRRGRRIMLRRPRRELAELLVMCGLWDLFPRARASGFEAVGKAEEREEGRGVEEGVDPGDPAV